MTQEERLSFLIRYLLAEDPAYAGMPMPGTLSEQRRLLRGLLNVRPPKPVSAEFLEIQDAYLQERLKERGITPVTDITPMRPGLSVWQGDITTLAADAIVNAANSQMLGCFAPCHGCIDNAIHTYAGVQLRLECAEIMRRQGHAEETGQAKLTKAYNLPCRYVLHTVGPVVHGAVTKRGPGAARKLLPLLSGLGIGKRPAQRRVLLHLDRGIPFSKRRRGKDCRADRPIVPGTAPGCPGGDFQCVSRQRRRNLPAASVKSWKRCGGCCGKRTPS